MTTTSVPGRPRSTEVTAGRDRAPARSMLRAVGFTDDDFERSVAGFTRYDVLVVNSLRDGLNLVAKEGPLVNPRHGVLCLSPEAGAYAELHEAALAVHPFDVKQTAQALHRALSMADDERRDRAERLRELVMVHTPRTWFDALVTHAR